MSWSCFIDNETTDALSLTGWALSWGIWKAEPGLDIAANGSGTNTFECDSSFGKVSGSVSYAGPGGTVTFTFDVPLLFGDPTYTAVCTGAYTASPIESQSPQLGGVMFKLAKSATPQAVSVVPQVTPGAANQWTPPPSNDPAISFHVVRPARPVNTAVGTNTKLWTTNPNEVPTVTTTPGIEIVLGLIRKAWPELGELGARTLTAQSAFETTNWINCYNYNFGNVKSDGKQKFMCLKNNRECFPKAYADAQIAKWPNVVYYPDDDFNKKHGPCACQGRNVAVVTQPPHPASWFRASTSYEEGSARYLGHHKGIAAKRADYAAALVAGDIDTVAHILSSNKGGVGYYNGSEVSYRNGMRRAKDWIDTQIGTLAAAPPSTAAPASSASPSTPSLTATSD